MLPLRRRITDNQPVMNSTLSGVHLKVINCMILSFHG